MFLIKILHHSKLFYSQARGFAIKLSIDDMNLDLKIIEGSNPTMSRIFSAKELFASPSTSLYLKIILFESSFGSSKLI